MPQKTTGRGGTFCRHNAAAHAPNNFPFQGKRFCRSAAGQHNCIGTPQRTQRLPQASSRKQAVLRILRRDQHNVEVAGQRAVLKAVVEQMKLRSEFRFGEASCLVAIFADNHRHLQLARNQQRLIAKLLRQSCGIDQTHTLATGARTRARAHRTLRHAPSAIRPAAARMESFPTLPRKDFRR